MFRILLALCFITLRTKVSRDNIFKSLNAHYIGGTGTLSEFDALYAKEYNIPKLSQFSIWMLQPIIRHEKYVRTTAYNEYIRKVKEFEIEPE